MDVDTAILHITDLWPEFPRSIVGATANDISVLESAVRRELPSSYRAFLTRMGRQDAGLAGGFTGADFNIDTLREHYEYAVWGVPSPLVLIGIDHNDGEVQMHTCLAGRHMDDPPVVYTVLRRGMPAESLPAAQSLGELVFRYGFCNFFAYHLRIEGWGQLLRPDATKIAWIDQQLGSAGLSRHPASEGYAAYFIGEGLVAHYTCPPGADRLILLVHGQDEAVVCAVMKGLARDLGVRTDWIGETVDQHEHLQSDDNDDDNGDEDDDDNDNDERGPK